MTASAVLVLTTIARAEWPPAGRLWLRIYALGLVLLAAFPEAPWDESAHDVTVAWLHTAAVVTTGVAFLFGVTAVSRSRSGNTRAKVLDMLVIASIVLIPQLMLLVEERGLFQRLMVLLGYVWLIAESTRTLHNLDDSQLPELSEAGHHSSRPTSR